MRRLYARNKLMTWVTIPCATALTGFFGMFVSKWSQDLVLALATFVAMSCFAATRFALLTGKVRVIRDSVANKSGRNAEQQSTRP